MQASLADSFASGLNFGKAAAQAMAISGDQARREVVESMHFTGLREYRKLW